MGISSTEASLRAIREDLDLPAAGSIDERAVLNKINKPYLPVSLSEYKGNILGTQLYIPGGTMPKPEDQWPKRRDESFATYYGGRGGYVRLSGDRIQVQVQDTTTMVGDYGTEVRICGKVLEDGQYRLTGTAYGDFPDHPSNNSQHAQLHVQLLANAGDYILGIYDLLVDDVYIKRNGSTFDTDRTVNLSTSKPYITLIFRYIITGSGIGSEFYTHEFTNFKLVKE